MQEREKALGYSTLQIIGWQDEVRVSLVVRNRTVRTGPTVRSSSFRRDARSLSFSTKQVFAQFYIQKNQYNQDAIDKELSKKVTVAKHLSHLLETI